MDIVDSDRLEDLTSLVSEVLDSLVSKDLVSLVSQDLVSLVSEDSGGFDRHFGKSHSISGMK